ncbi:HET-domain-containing protein [Tothia fuscella]|uniref:HET-domain-containing protein n=1 Tax=Tothia fuscella TaxID=1048955 RepID=A0A9P4NHJ1_9PEZI|nr:HET-domain-containing protein [Tothia fuscella]
MSENNFVHKPIDLERPSLRLIRLHQGYSYEYPIACDIFDAYLDEAEDDGIPYEALSYTWGDPREKPTISVNGREMRVTQNLFHALENLRQPHVSRILWIDAICINQDDHKERGHQVQQMGNIYRKAERVVIWLGSATTDSDRVMDFMHEHFTNNPYIIKLPGTIYQANINLSKDYGRAVESLLGRPWFRRRCILQEVSNARRAMICCGAKTVSSRAFAIMPQLLVIETPPHVQPVLDVMPGNMRQWSWWSKEPTLSILLQKFHRSEATDERDMIYALLGMASDGVSIYVDYNKSIHQVLREAMAVTIFQLPPNSALLDFLHWDWCYFVQHLDRLGPAVLARALHRQSVAAWKKSIGLNGEGECWQNDQQSVTHLGAVNQNMLRTVLNLDGLDVNRKNVQHHIAVWRTCNQILLCANTSTNDYKDTEIYSPPTKRQLPVLIVVEREHLGSRVSILLCGRDGKHEYIGYLLLPKRYVHLYAENVNGRTFFQLAIKIGAEYTRCLMIQKERRQETEYLFRDRNPFVRGFDYKIEKDAFMIPFHSGIFGLSRGSVLPGAR